MKLFNRKHNIVKKNKTPTNIFKWENLNTHCKTTSGTKALEWIKQGYEVQIIDD